MSMRRSVRVKPVRVPRGSKLEKLARVADERLRKGEVIPLETILGRPAGGRGPIRDVVTPEFLACLGALPKGVRTKAARGLGAFSKQNGGEAATGGRNRGRRPPPLRPRYNLRYRFKGWGWEELFDASGVKSPEDREVGGEIVAAYETEKFERFVRLLWDASEEPDEVRGRHPLAILTRRFCLALARYDSCYDKALYRFLGGTNAYTRLRTVAQILGSMWT